MYIHTPKFYGNFLTLAFEYSACPICKKRMVEKDFRILEQYGSIRGTGLSDGGNSIKAQLKRGNLTARSSVTNKKDEYICIECADAGEGSFVCALCHIEQPANEIYDRWGDPPEFLCRKCYETTPAKKWNEKVDKLYRDHQYDFD